MQFQGREASESSLGDEGTNTASLDNFRKSFNLEGVINLSHTGKRLAVLRLLDADTESMIGRIQARFSVQKTGVFQRFCLNLCYFVRKF